MKLNEIIDDADEPMIITLIKQRMAKGEHVAYYIRSGDRLLPVWLHELRRSTVTVGNGNEVPGWIFVGYRGFKKEFKRVPENDLDYRWDLLPGKVKLKNGKKVWQLKRRHQEERNEEITEGKGDEVMAFTDYLQDRSPMSEKKNDVLREFCAHLFKNGWTYSEGPSNADFILGNNEEGKHRIVVPQRHHKSKDQNSVAYYYFRQDDPQAIPKTHYVVIPVTIPPEMIEKLNDSIHTAETFL